MKDIIAHLTRQAVFSRATFGPGPRTEAVLDHIEKEIIEVRKELSTNYDGETDYDKYGRVAKEQVDLVILSLDGLLRSVRAMLPPDVSADIVAELAWNKVVKKQTKNESRDWADWRTADPNKAIEHVRGTHD